jgi:hypothetical protein
MFNVCLIGIEYNVYLPCAKTIDIFFLKQILSGKKKVCFNELVL